MNRVQGSGLAPFLLFGFCLLDSGDGRGRRALAATRLLVGAVRFTKTEPEPRKMPGSGESPGILVDVHALPPKYGGSSGRKGAAPSSISMKPNQYSPNAAKSTAHNGTRVRFSDDRSKGGVVVDCETDQLGGMLAPLVQGLSRLELEVHQIESRLKAGVRSERLLVAAADGEPLSQRRQALLRAAVFSALDSMQTTPSEAPHPKSSAQASQ